MTTDTQRMMKRSLESTLELLYKHLAYYESGYYPPKEKYQMKDEVSAARARRMIVVVENHLAQQAYSEPMEYPHAR